MRLARAIRTASQELLGLLFDLSGTYPDAVAYVAEPAIADRLGLSVSAEVDGLATGLLADDDGAAHVFWWDTMLERRVEFDERVCTDGLPDPVPAVSFLLLESTSVALERGIATGNWRGIRAFRGVN